MVRTYAVPNGGIRYAEYLSLEQAESAYWVGHSAELLGLSDQVDHKQFNLLERGLHPTTEERLRPRIASGQTRNGGHYSRGRTVYDVVVIAPKSAAVMGLFDSRLIEAHKECVLEIQRQIEALACVRVRTAELNETNQARLSGNIVAGVWLHERNRELEPLIHSHIAVVNMSYDTVEQRWKALQPVEFYRHRWDLTESYRHAMAERIMSLGYDLQARYLNETRYPKEQIREREWGFEIAGVSPAIVERYGLRTAQRDRAISEHARNNPEEPITERIIDALVREHRRPKQAYSEVERQQHLEAQREKLTPSERQSLHQLAERAYEQSYKMHPRMESGEGEDHGPRHRELTYGPRVNL